jgi:mRNA interferase RelE/StbE
LIYTIFIEKQAQRMLSRIAQPDQDRLAATIQCLANEPRPHGVKKLSGRNAWRIRVGDYRIIYEITDSCLMILVVAISHRRDIYRKL